MSDVLIKALELGAQGYPVFPVAASKRPTCPQGFKDAAIEPREIRRLWRDHPAPLIGVPTGEASGLFVLDIDSPRHIEAAEWLERCAPYLPETRQQTTRSPLQRLSSRSVQESRCRFAAARPTGDYP